PIILAERHNFRFESLRAASDSCHDTAGTSPHSLVDKSLQPAKLLRRTQLAPNSSALRHHPTQRQAELLGALANTPTLKAEQERRGGKPHTPSTPFRVFWGE